MSSVDVWFEWRQRWSPSIQYASVCISTSLDTVLWKAKISSSAVNRVRRSAASWTEERSRGRGIGRKKTFFCVHELKNMTWLTVFWASMVWPHWGPGHPAAVGPSGLHLQSEGRVSVEEQLPAAPLWPGADQSGSMIDSQSVVISKS